MTVSIMIYLNHFPLFFMCGVSGGRKRKKTILTISILVTAYAITELNSVCLNWRLLGMFPINIYLIKQRKICTRYLH